MREELNNLIAVLAVAAGIGWSVPHSNADLFVTSRFSNTVVHYDETTGIPLGSFISGGGLAAPLSLTFGPDGNLYVGSAGSDAIRRYSGTTGAFIDIFASDSPGGRLQPQGLVFGPDGSLYVASAGNNAVLRYNGTTGAFLNIFASGEDFL